MAWRKGFEVCPSRGDIEGTCLRTSTEKAQEMRRYECEDVPLVTYKAHLTGPPPCRVLFVENGMEKATAIN